MAGRRGQSILRMQLAASLPWGCSSVEQVSSTYPVPETGIPKRKKKKINGEIFNIILALCFKPPASPLINHPI